MIDQILATILIIGIFIVLLGSLYGIYNNSLRGNEIAEYIIITGLLFFVISSFIIIIRVIWGLYEDV